MVVFCDFVCTTRTTVAWICDLWMKKIKIITNSVDSNNVIDWN